MNFYFPACFLFYFILSPAAALAFKVVIDPGHGGSDLGAVRDRFVESKIVFEIAQKLKTELNKKNIELVYLTRTDDRAVTLEERVELAHKLKADLFMSLHANTSNSSRLSGMEFYFMSPAQLKKTESAGRALTNNEVLEQIQNDFYTAAKIERSLLLSKSLKQAKDAVQTKSVIKQAPFYVIENTQMPSVLIEVGFLSNRREAKKLSTDAYQNEIAERLADAIVEYKEKSDKNISVYEN